MTDEAIDLIRQLTADEIAQRRAALAEEDRILRVLLRSARSKETATKQKARKAAGKLSKTSKDGTKL